MAVGSTAISYGVQAQSAPKGLAVLLGRLPFVAIFLVAGANHFPRQTIAFAAPQAVPLVSVTVPLSGILALAGGLSILLGYRARLGAWLIALFLVPATLMMHKVWAIADRMMQQIQMVVFMKSIAILGGALLISQFGAGPLSLDARRSQ